MLIQVMVVVAIISVLIALLLPAVKAARETARRGQANVDSLRCDGAFGHQSQVKAIEGPCEDVATFDVGDGEYDLRIDSATGRGQGTLFGVDGEGRVDTPFDVSFDREAISGLSGNEVNPALAWTGIAVGGVVTGLWASGMARERARSGGGGRSEDDTFHG